VGGPVFRECHHPLLTRYGYRSLKSRTARNAEADDIRLVRQLRQMDPAVNPHLDRMPPFAGNEQEAAWVGKYLSTLSTK